MRTITQAASRQGKYLIPFVMGKKPRACTECGEDSENTKIDAYTDLCTECEGEQAEYPEFHLPDDAY